MNRRKPKKKCHPVEAGVASHHRSLCNACFAWRLGNSGRIILQRGYCLNVCSTRVQFLRVLIRGSRVFPVLSPSFQCCRSQESSVLSEKSGRSEGCDALSFPIQSTSVILGSEQAPCTAALLWRKHPEIVVRPIRAAWRNTFYGGYLKVMRALLKEVEDVIAFSANDFVVSCFVCIGDEK